MTGRLAPLAVGLALAGCPTATSVLLEVDTDLELGREIDGIEVRVEHAGEQVWSIRHDLGPADDLPQSLRLLPGTEVSGAFTVEVSALSGDDRILTARRESGFRRGREVVERFCLLRRCLGASDAACLEGRCDGASSDADADADVETDGETDGDGDADADEDFDVDVDVDADEELDADQPLCVEGETRCVGDLLERCETGLFVRVEECPLGCSDELARCLRLEPSNVERDLMDLPSVDLVVDGHHTLDTDECTVSWTTTEVPTEVVSTPDGSSLCVVIVESLTVAAGASLDVVGSNPLVVLSAGEVVVLGTIDVSATGAVPGPGGGRPGDEGEDAPGTCGGGAGAPSRDYSASSGGGGGGHGARGGWGGDAGWAADGGAGGAAAGSASLVPLSGGCGGGGGGDLDGVPPSARGGGGGGALQVSSALSVVLAAGGAIRAGGGGGFPGDDDQGGGGGGAGGGVLLEAPSITVDGTIAANGGGGGGADEAMRGEDGRADDDRASSGGGPGGGGSGGAGTTPEGEDSFSEGSPDPETRGGGGAAGRVRLNSLGAAAMVTGLVSPSTMETFTEGTISTW